MRPERLAELAAYSAALGRDPEQVQAAGGNTSLKERGILWVKASGMWLADALARDVFVPVALTPVLDAVAADAADPVTGAVVAERNAHGLRPSIETTLHALLPHRVVVHTHSVRTIALAIRADGEAQVTERLAGLRWAWVPYRKPGLPLTRRVAEALRRGPADILILGNHGLVVGGDDVPSTAALIAEVEQRLDGPCRRLALEAEPPAPPPGYRLPVHSLAHTLALDGRRQERACTGSLYPDHVIFLGPAALGESESASPSKLLLQRGRGAFLAADTEASADELALCLALVLDRVPEDARLRYLTAADEAELMNWDAEQYRQALARSLGR